MKPKRKPQEPQLPLGLTYSENRFIRYILFRLQKVAVVLDQLSFWRSPLLWFHLCLNAFLIYALLPLSISSRLPPEVPIFYYGITTDRILINAGNLPYVLILFFIIQLITIVIASRNYYRMKQLSIFLIIAATIVTALFGITMYKSIALTLPVS